MTFSLEFFQCNLNMNRMASHLGKCACEPNLEELPQLQAE